MKCFCGSESFSFVVRVKNRKIVKCDACGLERTEKLVSARDTKKIISSVEKDFLEEYLGEIESYREYFSGKVKKISKYIQKGKLLDIGCGPGVFLEEMKKAAFTVLGVDMSAVVVDYCKSKSLQVMRKSIYDSYFKNRKYDIVSAFQVIEHTTDADKFIKKIYPLLRKNGLITLSTPDVDGFIAKIQGTKWFEYYNLEHNYFFTMESIKILLEKNGFEILELYVENGRKINLSYVVGRLKYFYYNKSKSVLAKLLRNIDEKKLSIFDGVTFREPRVNIFVIAKKI